MNTFNRALALTLAVTIALPFQVFADNEISNASIQSIESPDELLEKLPAEVKVLGVLTEKDAEFYVQASKPVNELLPIGRAIENRKTKSTLQFVCLQDVTKVEECTKFQMRKNGEKLTGAKYIIKTVPKEIFVSQLNQKIKEDKYNRKMDYVGYGDIDMIDSHNDFFEWYTEDCGVIAFVFAGLGGGIALGFAIGKVTTDVAGLILGIVIGASIALTPFVVATAVVVGVGLFVIGQRNLVNIKMAFKKRKLNKVFRAMMDGGEKITKPYRVSDKNFKYVEKVFAGGNANELL